MDAAVEAGKEIMRIYNDPSQDFGIEIKADQSPLTLADKASHACIMRHLLPTGIPVLSEEGAHLPYEQRKAWQKLWIVDPLDGTKEFIKKNGEFTVNIALVIDGTPLFGAIYVPATDVIYMGIVGTGAWRIVKEKPVRNRRTAQEISEDTEPSARQKSRPKERPLDFQSLPLRSLSGRTDFTVVASRSHINPETEDFIGEMRSSRGEVQLVSRGSSLKICLVAEGSADVYPRFAPTMEWDTAAGDAIARAAGCKVLDAKTGLPLIYNKPDLHNPWFIVEGEGVSVDLTKSK